MKKVISFLMAFLLVFTTIPAGTFMVGADSVTSADGKYDYTVKGDTITIDAYNLSDGAEVIEIPETVDGYIVTQIGAFAFVNASAPYEVIIPKTVTVVEENAFTNSQIVEITVDEENETYCSVDGVLFSADKKTLVAFPQLKRTRTYTVSNTVENIANSAFCNNIYLYEIILPDSVENIGANAFEGCMSLVKINIPEKVTELKMGTFIYCYDLRVVELTKNITSIHNEAFMECYALWHILYDGTQEEYTEMIDENVFLCDVVAHCGATMEDILLTVETEPACQEPGNIALSCRVCEEENGAMMPPFGHTKGEFISSVEGSCSLPGHDIYKCAVCEEEFETNFVYIEHTPGELIESSVADCNSDGYDMYICSVCEETYKTNYELALGHNFDSFETAQTCTFGNVSIGHCDRCEENIATIDGMGTGHNFENGECTVCGETGLWGYRFDYEYGGIAVENYNGQEKDIVIPEKIEGLDVVRVGYAFQNFNGFETVTFPSSIKNIENSVLFGVNNLKSITVDKENKYYSSADGILYDKNKEKIICYPRAKTNKEFELPASVKVIDDQAFCENSNLKSIVFPEGLKEIGSYAFRYCPNLNKINIPAGLTTVGDSAFGGCHSILAFTVSDENQYFATNNGVLYNKDFTKLVAYPYGKQDEIYVMPETVTETADSVFADNMQLSSVVFPEGLSEIKYDTFAYATQITSVYIPQSVTSIGFNAFATPDSIWHIFYGGTEEQWQNIVIEENNYSLYNTTIHFNAKPTDLEVSIPENTACVGRYYVDFKCKLCDAQKSKEYHSSHIIGELIEQVEVSCSKEGYDVYSCLNCGSAFNTNYVSSTGHSTEYVDSFSTCSFGHVIKSHCSKCDLDVYEMEYGGPGHNFLDGICTVCSVKAGFSYNYNDQINGIEISGYYQETGTATIPDTIEGIPVKGIGSHALSGNFTSIIIPAGIEYIDNYAFGSADSLEEVVISQDNKYFCSENGVIYNKNKSKLYYYPKYKNDKIFNIPDTVIDLDIGSLYNNPFIETVNIPAATKRIDTSVFNSCTMLKNINVSGENAVFASVDGILFNKSLDKIICYPAGKENATYTMPDSVTTIGENAFSHNNTLKAVVFSESLTNIGNYAFQCNSSLEKINIGENVTYIGEEAFVLCDNLMGIFVSDSNTKYSDIDGVLFNKDASVLIAYPAGKNGMEYTVPDSVISIKRAAFSNSQHLIKLVISEGVKNLDDYTIDGAGKIKVIVLPESLETVGMTGLGFGQKWHILYAGTAEQWNQIQFDMDNYDIFNSTIHFEASAEDVEINIVDATCTENGSITVECKLCGEKTEETIWADHKGIYVETIAPTCESDGYDRYHCTVCDEDYGMNNISNLGHNIVSYELFDTCAMGKITKEYCDRCDTDIYGYLGENGKEHIYENGACTVCGTGDDWSYYFDYNLHGVVIYQYLGDSPSAVIPEYIEGLRVVGINDWAFGMNLVNVYIPSSIKEIRDNAFYNSMMLKSVYYGGSEEDWLEISIMYENDNLLNADISYNADGIPEDAYDGIVHPDFMGWGYNNGYGWGDIDNNGYLDETDLDMLTKSAYSWLFGDGSLACKAADINADDKIDMKDIVRIKKVLGIVPGGGGGGYTGLNDIPDHLG